MMTKPIVTIICFLLINALCVYGGYQWADNSWQSEWDLHMLADSEVNRKSAEDALTRQNKLIKDLDNAQQIATVLQEKHDRNVADNRAANDRLRSEFDKLKAIYAAGNSGTVISSAAAATDRLVLAQLLDSTHAAYGIVAEYADRNRQAVINCNNEYNAVRTALNAKVD